MHGVLTLRIDITLSEGTHEQTKNDDREDTGDLKGGEFSEIESYVTGHECHGRGQDIISDDSSKPKTSQKTHEESQEWTSTSTSDETEENSSSRLSLSLSDSQEHEIEDHSCSIIE